MSISLTAALALAFLPLPAVAAEPAPPPIAVAASDAAARAIRLQSIAAGTAVQDRALVGEAAGFDLGAGRIYVHLELDAAEPGAIEMVWRRDGDVVQTLPLDVGKSRRWRTWSYRRLGRGDAGRWTVTVVDAEGRALGELAFEVAPLGK